MINQIPVRIRFNNGRFVFQKIQGQENGHTCPISKHDNKRRLYEKEKCPECSFQPKWDWLQYNVNDEENKISCSVCIHYFSKSSNAACANFKNKNLFVTGYSNFRIRLSSVVDHENSMFHKDSIAKQTAENNPKQTPAYNSL